MARSLRNDEIQSWKTGSSAIVTCLRICHGTSLASQRLRNDEFSLRIGDRLSRSIDKGIANSRFGLVVASPAFIKKPWPEYELRGLVAREIDEDRVILPLWHGVRRRQVLLFSPALADKVALETAALDAKEVAIRLMREICPFGARQK